MDRIKGSDVLVDLTVTGIDGKTFKELKSSSTAKFYASRDKSKTYTVAGSALIDKTDDTLRALVATKNLGLGQLYVDLTISGIPYTDSSGASAKRTEVLRTQTNVVIID